MQRYKQMRILLAEDNPDDVAITQRAFARTDAPGELTVARDGEEVLTLLFAPPEGGADEEFCPDLILLDLNLPRVSGLEVLR
jgi:two-component system response regulator